MRATPPRASLCRMSLSATSSGFPMRNAPPGPSWASKSRRVIGPHPRSFPISLTAFAQPGKYASAASFVVLEVEAEQRKRLDGRASADHHFGPAARQQVEGCEFLEQTNRVNGAQHRHRTREPDGLRARRGRTEDDGRGGIEELAAVVLPNAKRIQPELIGVLDLLDQIAQTVGCADRAAVLGERCREAVDTDFHVFLQGTRPSRPRGLATRFDRRATARGGTSSRHARGCRARVPPSVAPLRAIPTRLSRRE